MTTSESDMERLEAIADDFLQSEDIILKGSQMRKLLRTIIEGLLEPSDRMVDAAYAAGDIPDAPLEDCTKMFRLNWQGALRSILDEHTEVDNGT